MRDDCKRERLNNILYIGITAHNLAAERLKKPALTVTMRKSETLSKSNWEDQLFAAVSPAKCFVYELLFVLPNTMKDIVPTATEKWTCLLCGYA